MTKIIHWLHDLIFGNPKSDTIIQTVSSTISAEEKQERYEKLLAQGYRPADIIEFSCAIQCTCPDCEYGAAKAYNETIVPFMCVPKIVLCERCQLKFIGLVMTGE